MSEGESMNLPEGFEAMSPVQQALTVARHELATLHGLVAVDAAAPGESFSIDTNETVAVIDKALGQMDNRTNREVLRDCLGDFVERVSSPIPYEKISLECAIFLPEMAKAILAVEL